MISDELVVRSIINYLRNTPSVYSLVNNDPSRVVEETYQDFVSGYPRITIGIDNHPLTGDGTDRRKLSRVFWTVSVFSENNSSAECNRINGAVLNALFNSQIIGVNQDGVPSFRFLRVDLNDKTPAKRVGLRIWRAESYLESELYNTNVHL